MRRLIGRINCACRTRESSLGTTVGGLENPTFAKFTVLLSEPDRVYFQDSDRYPFHFDFARARLPDFATVSFVEYVRKSLFLEGQELLLGTVILPPDPNVKEVAIQFTGNEPFPRGGCGRVFPGCASSSIATRRMANVLSSHVRTKRRRISE